MTKSGIMLILQALPLLAYGCTPEAERVATQSGSHELAALHQLGKVSTDREATRYAEFLIENMPFKCAANDGGRAELYSEYIDSLEWVNSEHPTSDFSHVQLPGTRRNLGEWAAEDDIRQVKADQLWQDIIRAKARWADTPWRQKYLDEVFTDYILPYRINTEIIDYGWREQAFNDYKGLVTQECDDPLAVCKNIEEQLHFKIYSIFRSAGLRSYADYVSKPRGTCDDQCLYTAQIMRAVGLPVTFDIIPRWGSHNLGHSLNALLLPDGRMAGFNNIADLQNGLQLANKVPKIYRKTYRIQKKSLLYRHRDREYIPPLFSRFDLIDVTAAYDVPITDVQVPVCNDSFKARLGYLCVPNRAQWSIVAWGERRKSTLHFKDVGTNYNAGQTHAQKGENIGQGIVYLPVVLDEFGQYSVNAPFILAPGKAPHYLKPDTLHKRTIALHRKYPRLERVVKFAESLELCLVEGANKSDFSDAELLYTVTGPLSSRLQQFDIDNKGYYQHVRLRKHSGGFSIGELAFYDKDGRRLNGTACSIPVLASEATIKNVFDESPLTYFTCSGAFSDLWIGLEFQQPRQIAKIGLCPRTDDNDITPGDEYELSYWNGQWISLGRQIARGKQLIYEDVPDNALLFLRNRTKGVEERPFTYENGQQIWW